MIFLYTVGIQCSFRCLQEEIEQVLKLQYYLGYVSVANEKRVHNTRSII